MCRWYLVKRKTNKQKNHMACDLLFSLRKWISCINITALFTPDWHRNQRYQQPEAHWNLQILLKSYTRSFVSEVLGNFGENSLSKWTATFKFKIPTTKCFYKPNLQLNDELWRGQKKHTKEVQNNSCSWREETAGHIKQLERRLLYSGLCRVIHSLTVRFPPSLLSFTTEQAQTPRSPSSLNADITQEITCSTTHNADTDWNDDS